MKDKIKTDVNQPSSILYIEDEKPSLDYIGLTKRERFAGQAMQALVSNNFCPTGFQNCNEEDLAKIAVKCADLLIKELLKN